MRRLSGPAAYADRLAACEGVRLPHLVAARRLQNAGGAGHWQLCGRAVLVVQDERRRRIPTAVTALGIANRAGARPVGSRGPGPVGLRLALAFVAVAVLAVALV
ncbi:MAG TPA: hypothetical protein VIJ82_14315, partial [Streptosporangiaceae bacterium]